MKKLYVLAIVILLAAIALVACSSSNSTASPAATTASSSGGTSVADGKTLLETRCVSCHSLAKVVNQHGDASQWQQVVTAMVNRGAQLTTDEQKVLVQYLADNFK